jgi:hypothetical protein
MPPFPKHPAPNLPCVVKPSPFIEKPVEILPIVKEFLSSNLAKDWLYQGLFLQPGTPSLDSKKTLSYSKGYEF